MNKRVLYGGRVQCAVKHKQIHNYTIASIKLNIIHFGNKISVESVINEYLPHYQQQLFQFSINALQIGKI